MQPAIVRLKPFLTSVTVRLVVFTSSPEPIRSSIPVAGNMGPRDRASSSSIGHALGVATMERYVHVCLHEESTALGLPLDIGDICMIIHALLQLSIVLP